MDELMGSIGEIAKKELKKEVEIYEVENGYIVKQCMNSRYDSISTEPPKKMVAKNKKEAIKIASTLL